MRIDFPKFRIIDYYIQQEKLGQVKFFDVWARYLGVIPALEGIRRC